jgi:hypothetical protein
MIIFHWQSIGGHRQRQRALPMKGAYSRFIGSNDLPMISYRSIPLASGHRRPPASPQSHHRRKEPSLIHSPSKPTPAGSRSPWSRARMR